MVNSRFAICLRLLMARQPALAAHHIIFYAFWLKIPTNQVTILIDVLQISIQASRINTQSRLRPNSVIVDDIESVTRTSNVKYRFSCLAIGFGREMSFAKRRLVTKILPRPSEWFSISFHGGLWTTILIGQPTTKVSPKY